MKKIDVDLLEMLNDDDIKLIIAETKLDMMLSPFKQNSKTYAKYMSRLGRLDSKSKMVKANLPGIVYELYNKGDLNMRKMLSNQARFLKNVIVEMLTEYETEKLTPESFWDMDSTRCVAILSDIENMNSNNRIDIDLFFLQLKLNAVDISENQKNEIKRIWNEQKEKEAALKIVEDTYKNEIKILKKDYEAKISIAEQTISNLKVKIKKQEISFEDLTNKLEVQKEDNRQNEKEIKELLTKLEFSCKQLEKKEKEMSDTEKELGELKRKNESRRLELEHAWQKKVEDDNKKLIEKKEQLIGKNKTIQMQIDSLLDDRSKAEEQLKQIKECIFAAEEQLTILKNDIDNYSSERENILSSVSQNSASVQSSGLNLYIEPGMCDIQREVCEKYSQYIMAVETNMDNVGCKISSGVLDNIFNAAVDVGLIPLLCGFGARKAAMALIAARYGEIPTIISIPSGYNDVAILSREIDKAKTTVIIIEDLFGRMNEEIILPILRREIDKQLVFCAESFECLKYTDFYFMNYVQLIKVNIRFHKSMKDLVFADAKNLFRNYKYLERSDIHKKMKKLFKEINVPEIYVQSRGDMFAYLSKIAPNNINSIFEEWLEYELWEPEKKEIIKERLSKDFFGTSEELIERLNE